MLKELRATTSRLDKEAILSRAIPLELDVFNYANDYGKVYHVKQVGCIDMNNLGEPSDELFNELDYILNSSFTPTEIMGVVDTFADTHGDLIRLIVRKNLDCGATAKTVNKVFPGTIPEFNIQLAKEVPLAKVSFPCLAQIKYDGVRLVIIKRRGTHAEFYTRNGKLVALPKLSAKLDKTSLSSFVLDSEVTLLTGKMEDRTSVSGLINSAMHGGQVDEDCLRFNVFDAMTVEEWDDSKCFRTYKNRFKQTMFILETMQDEQFIPALTMPVDSVEQVNGIYNELIAEGYEGLILKTEDHKYTFKRSKDWVKMKETKSADLMCTNVIGGDGKYTGMIGALTVSGLVEGHEVVVNVGSGMTDAQRSYAPHEYAGKTIEVKYNAVIQNSTTKAWSLFLPRFTCVRIDK